VPPNKKSGDAFVRGASQALVPDPGRVTDAMRMHAEGGHLK